MARQPVGRDIVIITRTDVLADCGYGEACKRWVAAVEAGADVVFLEGVRSIEEAKRFCGEMGEIKRRDWGVGVLCLHNCVPARVSPVLSVQEARGGGFRLVIAPTLALGMVFEAGGAACKEGSDGKRRYEGSLEFDVEAGRELYENGV
ncbi:hypothetical protein EG329_004694 [Mollisiaceae sp. DMI_Dod_QoI]|nr:hypothetical protein EG329_004694 [Helotiales sp. DMI_Dod_QoI]